MGRMLGIGRSPHAYSCDWQRTFLADANQESTRWLKGGGGAIDGNSGINQNNQREPDSFIYRQQSKNNSKKAWEYIRYKHWI